MIFFQAYREMRMQQIPFQKYSRIIEPYSEVYIVVLCAVIQESRCGVLIFIYPEGNFRFRQLITVKRFSNNNRFPTITWNA